MKKSKWSKFKQAFLWPVWYYVLIIVVAWFIANQLLRWTFVLVRSTACFRINHADIVTKTGEVRITDARPIYFCEY